MDDTLDTLIRRPPSLRTATGAEAGAFAKIYGLQDWLLSRVSEKGK